MLHRESVSSFLIKILEELMSFESLSDFRLVGGTAIALQIGHRCSVDIDLFSDKYSKKYDFELIYREVKNKLGSFSQINLQESKELGLTCVATNRNESVKLDFWKWPNPFLNDVLLSEKIRMAHLDDLIAMKLEAINDRSNYRDYIDIAFLSEHYTFSQMLNLYTKRTLSRDYTRIVKALSNPADLVKDQELKLLKAVSEKELKDRVDYLLFVYTKERVEPKKRGGGS